MPMELNALTDRGTSDAYSRRFGLTAQFGMALAPELFAVAYPGEYPELFYHQGWRRWQVGVPIAAVAAQAGKFQIRNPDASSSLVVVEKIVVSMTAATEIKGDFGYGPGNVDLATIAGTHEFRDGRQVPSGKGLAIVSHTTEVPALVAFAVNAVFAGNAPFELPGAPWVMVPGNVLTFAVTALNTILFYNIVWRERRLQDQENVP